MIHLFILSDKQLTHLYFKNKFEAKKIALTFQKANAKVFVKQNKKRGFWL